MKKSPIKTVTSGKRDGKFQVIEYLGNPYLSVPKDTQVVYIHRNGKMYQFTIPKEENN